MTVLRRWAMVSIVLSANSLRGKSVIFIKIERRLDSLPDRLPNEFISCIVNTRFQSKPWWLYSYPTSYLAVACCAPGKLRLIDLLASNQQDTYLIHNQYFSPLENSPGHAQKLFFPDLTWDHRSKQSKGRDSPSREVLTSLWDKIVKVTEDIDINCVCGFGWKICRRYEMDTTQCLILQITNWYITF